MGFLDPLLKLLGVKKEEGGGEVSPASAAPTEPAVPTEPVEPAESPNQDEEEPPGGQ